MPLPADDERPQWPAEWLITSQVFWRSAAGAFKKSAKVGVSHKVSSERSRIVLPLPALSPAPAQLRLDITDRPAFLLVHTISVLDARGEVLWSAGAAACAGELNSLSTADGEGLLVSGTSAGGSLLLPLEASALDRLAGGGAVTVEASALDPWSYAARLADAATRERMAARDAELLHLTTEIGRLQDALTRSDRSLGDLVQRLQIIENSLAWRLVRPLTGMRPRGRNGPPSGA